jgi:putative NADPH-quinone reductase
MTRFLVVYSHPCGNCFVSAVRDRALAALELAGAEVRVDDLYRQQFEPAFSDVESANHLLDGVDPAAARHAANLQWCEALVLVYPTWWGGQPAMLKGWIDRVWVKGVAWDLPDGADRLRPRLGNVRRLIAITTHGSSKLINVIEGEGGKRTVTRSLRPMCHPLARSHWIAMYDVDRSSAADRVRFLDRVERRITRLAR